MESSTIAEAFVTMRPDLTKFRQELEEGMKGAQSTTVAPKISIPTEGFADAARGFAANIGQALTGGISAITSGVGSLLKNAGSGLLELGKNVGSGLLTGLKNAGSMVTSLAQTVVKGFAVMGVAAVAAGGLMLKGAAEEEQSIAQLSAAVKAAGGDWDAHGKKIEETVMAWQRLSGVAHDEIRPAFSLMIAQTGDVNEAIARMPYALDLARGANIDLSTASRLVGKVSDETVMVLSRLGIVLEKDAKEADVFAAIQQRFGGQAQAFARTAIGGWQLLRYEFDEIVETLGTALLPVFTQVTGAITGFLRRFDETGQLEKWTQTIGNIAGAVGEMFQVLTGIDPAAGGILAKLIGQDEAEFVMNFLATIRDTFQTTFDVIGAVITGFRTGNWLPLVAEIEEGGAKLFERFETMGEQIGTLIASIATAFIDNWPLIQQTLGTWAQAFIDWVGPLIPQLLAKFGELLTNIFTWVQANAPAIVAQLAAWGQAFIAWIAPLIPPFLQALGSLLQSALAWVLANAPAILAQLAEWAKAFVAWVGPQIPVLLGALADLLKQLVAWIAAKAPDIGKQLGEWAMEFMRWIAGTAIPELIEHLPEIVSTVLGFIRDVPMKLAGALIDVGVGFIRSFMDGIDQEKTALWNTIVGIGEYAIEGLARGLSNMWGWIQGRIHDLVMLIPEVIRNLLGIHSPSAVMADIGEEVPAGLAEGMTDNLPALDDFIPRLVAWIDTVVPAIAPSARGLGTSIIEGVIVGLTAFERDLSEALLGLIEKVVTELLPRFRTWGETLGDEFAEGMKDAIEKGIGSVQTPTGTTGKGTAGGGTVTGMSTFHAATEADIIAAFRDNLGRDPVWEEIAGRIGMDLRAMFDEIHDSIESQMWRTAHPYWPEPEPEPAPGQPGYRLMPWESPTLAGANVNPITGQVEPGTWVWVNGQRVKLADGVSSVNVQPATVVVQVDGESIATAEARYTDEEARRYGYNTGVNR